MAEEHFEKLVRKLKENVAEWQDDLIECRRLTLDPRQLADWGIPVTRVVQKAGEYVLVAPSAVHWGINSGFGCKSALNVMYGGDGIEYWRRACKTVDDTYKKYGIFEWDGRHVYSNVSWVETEETARKLNEMDRKIAAESH